MKEVWVLGVVLLLIGFSCAVTVPAFSNTTCASKVCVGFVEGEVGWYVYKARSYSESTSEIDGDKYLNVKPLTAAVCPDSTCTSISDLVNLQNATSLTTEPIAAVWNEATGLSVNYTLNTISQQGANVSIGIFVYLLEYATTIKVSDNSYRISPGDFVIEYTWQWPIESGYFSLSTLLFHDGGSQLCQSSDVYETFQFGSGSCDDLIGYSFNAPYNGLLNDTLQEPVNFNVSSATTNAIIRVWMEYTGDYTGQYTMIVATGSNKFFIWMVTLVVFGCLLLCVSVVGVGYWVFREKKRAKITNLRDLNYESD